MAGRVPLTPMDEGDAGRMVERPEDSRRVAGGTRESTGRERQAFAVGRENTVPKATELMEEVVCRENLLRAWRLTQQGLLSLLDEHRRLESHS